MSQKPTDQLLESVSALMDNEASELELRRILKNAGPNDELLEHWRRYHIIGSVLRREQNVSGSVNLVHSVASALRSEKNHQEEPASVEAGTPERKNWKDLLGKSMVAASVAATMVIGFQLMNSLDEPSFGDDQRLATASGQSPGVDPVVSTAPLGFELPLPESRTVSSNANGGVGQDAYRMQRSGMTDDLTDAATQNLLNRRLIQHAERASVNGSLGILPFARISKLEEEPNPQK